MKIHRCMLLVVFSFAFVHKTVSNLPAIGFFCPGGRCVIVGGACVVAKVVNPLGTVITVPDEPAATDDDEEEVVVIHENCDEALFRPVVASKSLHYADEKSKNNNKVLIGDGVCTKSLKSTTEVTCKILKNKRSKNEKNHLDLSSHKINLSVKPPVKTLVTEQQQSEEVFEPEIPLNFEDAQELCEGLEKKPLKTSSSSEDVLIEEKTVTKKPRKPKAKLGVRIPTVKIEEKPKDDDIEPPKKSWSTIVSTKPKELIDLDFELTQCEQLTKNLFVDDVFNDTKCSDDEKVNSSQTETTESDDSAKIAAQNDDQQPIVDILVDANTQNKPTKRKSKKKKK